MSQMALPNFCHLFSCYHVISCEEVLNVCECKIYHIQCSIFLKKTISIVLQSLLNLALFMSCLFIYLTAGENMNLTCTVPFQTLEKSSRRIFTILGNPFVGLCCKTMWNVILYMRRNAIQVLICTQLVHKFN